MEPWPVLAWVLLLAFVADWVKSVQSRDFTVKDIVFLHPSTTPYPGGFKCFTCENAPDNYECNRYAPDVYCPREARYCSTRHLMDEQGASISVTKRCAVLADCRSPGCSGAARPGHQPQVCTSCCEGHICNMPVPLNETEAIFSTTSPLNRAQCTSRRPAAVTCFTAVASALLLSRI
ncbi:ly6/PLAUR domain-containing protein 6 isoform X1 [Paramormyrops kingsleyae]|uniref:LY6/PLAUR domain containing 6 n=1 Tax=Paramormyrops kingsleyae TaxID=1676925 RepID=A0A3B3RKG5_9TELE|nr:ly6/PLAUR domain-containing protein 6-like isoform X1 [Paramormyrops kingsleyae]